MPSIDPWQRVAAVHGSDWVMEKNDSAAKSVEGSDVKKAASENLPAAGPHAKPELTDNSKTPGAGTLPDDEADSVSPGSG